MLSTFAALSVNSAKHLGPASKILRFAQDDKGRQVDSGSQDESGSDRMVREGNEQDPSLRSA